MTTGVSAGPEKWGNRCDSAGLRGRRGNSSATDRGAFVMDRKSPGGAGATVVLGWPRFKGLIFSVPPRDRY